MERRNTEGASGKPPWRRRSFFHLIRDELGEGALPLHSRRKWSRGRRRRLQHPRFPQQRALRAAPPEELGEGNLALPLRGLRI
ncbi:unnamed protein product [Miscanthus lutarioriparius]|uniref:Uncharacterized protein n=1 Tax=Miscanthus lutarioriparius TaxID=422564 RepID=A0A811MLA0_9POAL|nr:unnamed protein product [Miscanthus lutarioriparius]